MENEITGVNKTESPSVDTTEIIAKRLAAMRAKDREDLAKAMGYESWDNAMNSGVDKQLLDAGIDPDMGKPVINKLVENHPEHVKFSLRLKLLNVLLDWIL